MKIGFMIIIAYLLGSIPSGLWVGELMYGKDISKMGSGNIGTTNAFRELGAKAGTIVLAMDVLKGTLAASQPYFFHSSINPLLIGVFASLGHSFSLFDHFHGGKAVATSAGILLAYNPPLFLVAALIFVGVLLLTSMASAASMTGITSVLVIALFEHDVFLSTIAGLLTALVLWRHRSNINRIIHGRESLVHFGLLYYLKHHHRS
ncbi:glycerol-3-phosphate 1-O-acyltransferase PlsY [uncultured Limosilactobacillus sp.]|uniref:glycerol-3-phosphate 1-O-acyltransferase PlsY n=1 Tax=uncultured Limosilactobacillus sp. TaxID=2837629 RepID=UPI0025DA605C|nr:glycerol-3-phosphate 1-O-acyltransferase PlsY [uncultured Limosilactobacillus sp.]